MTTNSHFPSPAPSAPFAPPTQAANDNGGFFAHHGLWAPGIRLFRQLRFAAKALIISLAFMVPMLGLVAWVELTDTEDALHARQDATRQHVEVAHGVLAWAYAQEASGAMTREQAQKLARQAISGLRYDKNEYFWINDMQAKIVMHPIKKELDGTDGSTIKDPNGFALFNGFVDKVRKDGKGFVPYQWPKPGQEQPVDKLSYVQGFEPWGWIIGSGIYVDDLRAAMLKRVQLTAGISLLAVLVAGYLFFCFYRVMDGGLKETRRHLRLMTAGDLTASPSPWGRDEAAQLMTELYNMQQSLRAMVTRVRHSSDHIVQASTEIASGAMDLSGRTEQTASNLEESAASMEQISATVATTTESTAQAAEVARHNASAAAQGGQVMQQVVSTMEAIRASSSQIEEITGTIDSIAFQTNILALNAAVEAARAGEQGRGFAVVASEVRALAQRSGEAAKQIKGLIGSSVQQIGQGAAVVRQAGESIAQIVASSQRVNQLLDEVSTGAREQNAGIRQIGDAVQELDRMTQQNAALVEETAAAASAMKDQADGLAGEVARFKLPGQSDLQYQYTHHQGSTARPALALVSGPQDARPKRRYG